MTKDGNTTGVDKFPCLGMTCHTSMTFVTRYNWRGFFPKKKEFKRVCFRVFFMYIDPRLSQTRHRILE